MKGISLYNSDFFTIKSDNDLLFESITRILLTTPGERPMSNFGCKLKSYLFEPHFSFVFDVEGEIKGAIETWEPRVVIQNVKIETENNIAKITLNLINKITLEPMTYETILRL